MNVKYLVLRIGKSNKLVLAGRAESSTSYYNRLLTNASALAVVFSIVLFGIALAATYVFYSSDSTYPTTNTLNLSGMTVGQSLTVSTDNSNSITVNDDTPGNIGNRKIKCRDSSPAMSGGRISSGNPDYQFELFYQSTQINCATTASSFYFSSQTGPQTANLTPMTLRLVKVGSSGSTASITYPSFQMCNIATSTSDSSGTCFTGTPTGQLTRYTPTTSFATVVVNSAPVITSNSAVSVNENQTAVTTVTATDGDGDTITYSISGGVDQSFFSINSSTGVLTFNSPPDFENPQDNNADNEYRVRVTASDGNGGSIEQTIAVTVLDVAENSAPVITSAATANAAENQTAVATVTATDGDGDTLSYS
ncbi:cadherin repeat domain-containing protein, partial [Candidatus Saccharibacteria bacterium]|nr:cadherin repeat domain-containing protein [Candidatus Saccharibacteria bacterium]